MVPRIRLASCTSYGELATAALVVAVMVAACKGDGTGVSHTLEAVLSPGVTGTPVPGSTSHSDGSSVDYDFQVTDGYQGLRVEIDGAIVPASGTVIMSSDHILVATADTIRTLGATDTALTRAFDALLTSPNPLTVYRDLVTQAGQLADQVGPVEAATRVEIAEALTYDPVLDAPNLWSALKQIGDSLAGQVAIATGRSSQPPPPSLRLLNGASPVTFLYVNGIWTSPTDYEFTRDEFLGPALTAAGFGDPTVYSLKGSYNRTWLYQVTDVGAAITCFRLKAQLLDLHLFSRLRAAGSCLASLGLPDLLESYIQVLTTFLGAFPTIAQADAGVLASRIETELNQGRRVVLVVHSQGNLLAQKAIEVMAASPGAERLRCVGVVGIAPPTSEGWPVGGSSVGQLMIRGQRAKDIMVFLPLPHDMALQEGVTNPLSDLYDQELASFIVRLNPFVPLFAGFGLHRIQSSYFAFDQSRQAIQRQLQSQVTAVGQNCPFTPPTVETGGVTLTGTTATATAHITPNGFASNAWFEWGTTSDLASFSETELQSVGSGTTVVPISAVLTGLTPATTYYYRAAAQNDVGTAKGVIQSFTTSGNASVILGEVRDAVTYSLIVGATVRLGPVGGTFDRQVITGVDGAFRFEGISPGTYQAEATAAGYVVNTAANVRIVAVVGGDVARADFALPPISSPQRFGSLSGRVFGQTGAPLGGATVTISGGSQTNGVFRAATTQTDGTYALTGIVLDDVNGAAITSFVVEASAAGHASASRTVTLVQNQTVTNVDFQLSPGSPVTVFFFDGFESALSWTTSGFWNQNALIGLRNTAFPTYVDLAPDDASSGNLPAPAAGTFALWYGQPASGNFLGQQVANDVEKSGGISVAPNEGTVVSPGFAVPATSQRATLRFDTWFEIESQNPNAGGFDIMSIAIEDVGTGAITELGRLNPFEDPTFAPRYATPYTSAGFNRAPVWHPVLVDLSAFRGMAIRLRFTFNTMDALYNGFRGWIIDNVQVSDESIPGATTASLRLAPASSTRPHTRRP